MNKSKVKDGITYTCVNVNGQYTWKKAGTNVSQSCSADIDVNKSKIVGGVSYTCVNTNGSYGWKKTNANVTQTCTTDADLSKARIEGGVNFVCVNLNEGTGKAAKYGWKKHNGSVTQTCNVDLDLSKTTIMGDVNVTCINANVNGTPTKVWAPPAGKTCPTANINGVACVENPQPVLYAVCKVAGEVFVLGGKTVVCGVKKTVVVTPGAPAPENCWTPIEEVKTAPITLTSNGDSLPVTGSSAALVAGVGIVLVAVGGGLFLVTRRRKATFTA